MSAYIASASRVMAVQGTIKISGDKLSKLWQESFLSKGTFAAKLGIGPRRFAKITTPGTHRIFRDRFTRMAEGLEIGPDQLLAKIGANSEDESPTVWLERLASASPEVQKSAMIGLTPSRLASLAEAALSVLAERAPDVADRAVSAANTCRGWAVVLRTAELAEEHHATKRPA